MKLPTLVFSFRICYINKFYNCTVTYSGDIKKIYLKIRIHAQNSDLQLKYILKPTVSEIFTRIPTLYCN